MSNYQEQSEQQVMKWFFWIGFAAAEFLSWVYKPLWKIIVGWF